MKRALMAVIFAVLAGSAQAQSASEKYDLAEQCARRAAEVFAKEWGDGTSTGQIVGSYENHYNASLNKCFYLEISTVYPHGKPPFRAMRLFDINEDKEIAIFDKTDRGEFTICLVQEKKWCRTEQEWRELIRPFMED